MQQKPRKRPPSVKRINRSRPTVAKSSRHKNIVRTPVVGFKQEGILVETGNGAPVMQESVDTPFNPASAVKLATTLIAFQKLGTAYRFTTSVKTDGEFNSETGILKGNLFIEGRDFSLRTLDAQKLIAQLQSRGISEITGKLVVESSFTIDFKTASASAQYFKQLLLKQSIKIGVATTGNDAGGEILLAEHQSGTLIQIAKVMLCYSSNYMAEKLGVLIGGPSGLKRSLIAEGVNPDGLQLASTSGLGINRVTPRAMMLILRKLVAELSVKGMSLTDILPVAGIDPGTLSKRYATSPGRGSVAAKTGTLKETDSGASALVGEMGTNRGGTLLFVILHNRGQVPAMRAKQDAVVAQVQAQSGGPSLLTYRPLPLLFELRRG